MMNYPKTLVFLPNITKKHGIKMVKIRTFKTQKDSNEYKRQKTKQMIQLAKAISFRIRQGPVYVKQYKPLVDIHV